MSSIKETPYESEILNEHLGDLKFAYTTFNLIRKENINSKSKKDKYIDTNVLKVITCNRHSYDIEEWKSLVESKSKELREYFIIDELVKRQRGLLYNINGNEDDIYLSALVVYTYRTWERATDPTVFFMTDESRNSWIDFNSMLETKYPEQMKNRLINQ